MRGTKPLGLSLVALLALVVALTIGASSALAVAAPTTVDLIAGQHQVVGTVTITPLTSTSLKVEYQLTSGCLTGDARCRGVDRRGDSTNEAGQPDPGSVPEGRDVLQLSDLCRPVRLHRTDSGE